MVESQMRRWNHLHNNGSHSIQCTSTALQSCHNVVSSHYYCLLPYTLNVLILPAHAIQPKPTSPWSSFYLEHLCRKFESGHKSIKVEESVKLRDRMVSMTWLSCRIDQFNAAETMSCCFKLKVVLRRQAFLTFLLTFYRLNCKSVNRGKNLQNIEYWDK